jgi:hypothetical protein
MVGELPPTAVATYRTYLRSAVVGRADEIRCDVTPVAAVNAPPVTSATSLKFDAEASTSLIVHVPLETAVTWRWACQPVVVAAASSLFAPVVVPVSTDSGWSV